MNYQEADSKLQGRCRLQRKLGNNTYLIRHEDSKGYYFFTVRLHSTDILTFYKDGSIYATTGGWATVTTKARLNRFLPTPWGVYSDSRTYGEGTILCTYQSAVFKIPCGAVSTLPCTIPKNGVFPKRHAIELEKLKRQTKDARNRRARERYKETFWIRKAREGGKLRKPLTLEAIKTENNASVKAAMIKIFGFERFFTQIQAQTLDTLGEYRLMAYPLNTWQTVRALKMVCPSTQLVHVHAVPPNVNTVSAALDWMFQTEGYLARLQAET